MTTAADLRVLRPTWSFAAARAATIFALLGSGAAVAAEDFVVGPGDKLAISVHRRDDLSGEFRVLPGGAVSLPFLGNLPVAGKSVEQVRHAVAQRLREDAALLDPRVSVEIAEMQPILVAGPVRRPGQYPSSARHDRRPCARGRRRRPPVGSGRGWRAYRDRSAARTPPARTGELRFGVSAPCPMGRGRAGRRRFRGPRGGRTLPFERAAAAEFGQRAADSARPQLQLPQPARHVDRADRGAERRGRGAQAERHGEGEGTGAAAEGDRVRGFC